MALELRPLGRSGLQVSCLSLGSWRTFERLPEQTGVEILRAAADEGITFLDDARYNDETGQAPVRSGYSEIVFGNLLRAAGLRRDALLVANKLWWEFWPGQSAAAELDGSLDRMGLDYVDLIYASPPPPGMPVAELVGTVSGLLDAGKARAWGILNWPAAQIAEAATAAKAGGLPAPCAAQLPYSLARRSPVEDDEMRAALAACGAGVVASFCLEGGVLTGKYARPATGRAAGTLGDERVRPALVTAAELTGLAGRLGTSAAALALAFALASPSVASVLFGATSAAQVRANCAAAQVLSRLSAADLADLMATGTGLAG